jgi:hypothetical protein
VDSGRSRAGLTTTWFAQFAAGTCCAPRSTSVLASRNGTTSVRPTARSSSFVNAATPKSVVQTPAVKKLVAFLVAESRADQ